MPSLAVLYDSDSKSWLRFTKPVEEIEIHNQGNVLSALDHIEARVEREGLYAAGFVSYEAAPAFDEALQTHPADGFPLIRFGLFKRPEKLELPACHVGPDKTIWLPKESLETFSAKVESIRSAIARGETYQVNLTFPMTGEIPQDPWQFFLGMVKDQQPVNCGFLQSDQWTVCSASPELFFKRDGEQITMRPMKGTAARGRTLAEDRLQAIQLQQSTKNRAENVMILDMVRNDLGRIAPPGEVKTEAICALERYPTVWQLTSTATATSKCSLAEVFKALFPCASITGAPKAKTMEIIKQSEGQPRRIYTGAFGWIAPGRKAQFNIAIRTALFSHPSGQAIYGVGAGITWDSDGAEEYRECLDKAAVLNRPKEDFALIETLRWTSAKGYFLLDEHLSRLRSSAEYFDFAFDPAKAESYLKELVRAPMESPQRVRFLLYHDGRFEASCSPIKHTASETVKICFARHAVDSQNIFLFHKTTLRKLYEQNLAEAAEAGEVILWNERGEVTEGCITNLVIEKQGRLVTPPVSCGLLPGTYRAFLIAKGILREEVLTKDDLRNSPRIFLINAVRKWRKARLTGLS